MFGADKEMKRARTTTKARNPALFQSLIAGLFCLLLVSLFLVTALMDVRRTQETLLDVFENQGVTLIETVRTIAQNKLKGLMGITSGSTVSFQDLESIEAGFRMQEAILTRLIDLARDVDRRAEERALSKIDLGTLIFEASLKNIVLYDAEGKISDRNGPVPRELSARIRPLVEGRDEIALDLKGGEAGEEPSYLVGVRRKNAGGMVVLVLGEEGLRYWSSRVAIQEAIEEGGWRKGVRYFSVTGSRGRLLGEAGRVPRETRSGVEPIRMKNGRSARRVIGGPPEVLEVYAPFKVSGHEATARVGLEIEEAVLLAARNRAHIFLTMGLMTAGALFSVVVLYRIQSRHLRKIEEMKERINQSERLSSMGRLAAGVAHEIRNPLNAISMAVQRIQREFGPTQEESRKEFSHVITVVREEIRRLNRIIEDFVGPAREKGTALRPERLSELLDRVARLAREEAGSRLVGIQCECEDRELTAYMDPPRIHQALLNLVKNAMESIEGQGKITLSARADGPDRALVRVRDTGVGIPAKDIGRIFDFEYTTKEKGLGMGLSIAREIVQAHGGEMRIESEPGRGTTVELTLRRKGKQDQS
ncbi:MAG: ATP-binding protein [Thermodesulfobacteriota bacterium]